MRPKVNTYSTFIFLESMKMKEGKCDSVQGIEEVVSYEKYFFKICPFTGRESLLPDKSCNRNVDGPICLVI